MIRAGTLLAREAVAHVTDAQGNPHTHQSAANIAAKDLALRPTLDM
jgi:fructose-1,6-bisphosphatase/inositol monophosphatase family enzyme